MARIGIVGGTFDPIHFGHLNMGLAVQKALRLDRVWFMPSGTPAYKLAEHGVTSQEDRLNMARLALRGYPQFDLSTFECERSGNTYTADTLRLLAGDYPENEWYFVMGADSLDYFEKWREPEVISRLAVIAAVGRTGFSTEAQRQKAEYLKQKFGTRVVFAEMEPVNVSSTEIRNLARGGGSLSGLLPESVISYIAEHRLYQEE